MEKIIMKPPPQAGDAWGGGKSEDVIGHEVWRS